MSGSLYLGHDHGPLTLPANRRTFERRALRGAPGSAIRQAEEYLCLLPLIPLACMLLAQLLLDATPDHYNHRPPWQTYVTTTQPSSDLIPTTRPSEHDSPCRWFPVPPYLRSRSNPPTRITIPDYWFSFDCPVHR